MQNEPDDRLTIDTSGMSEGKKKALEVAEASRETLCTHDSFCASMFMGRFRWDLMHPWPAQPETDWVAGQPFLDELAALLRDEVDPDEIDATGEIPDELVNRLADMGAFGIKVDTVYDGLGLSQCNYSSRYVVRQCVRKPYGAVIGAPKHRCFAAPETVWHGCPEKEVFAPGRHRGDFGLCPHRRGGGVRSRTDDNPS